jgi:hypothetical protein
MSRTDVLEEIFHVRVGSGYAIEIIIIFLDVLAVITLGIGQAKQSLLEDRVLAVPQSERKAEPLVVVTKAGEAVLTTVIGARARLSWVK